LRAFVSRALIVGRLPAGGGSWRKADRDVNAAEWRLGGVWVAPGPGRRGRPGGGAGLHAQIRPSMRIYCHGVRAWVCYSGRKAEGFSSAP